VSAWIGIDPGQTGGLALVSQMGNLIAVERMPAITGEVDAVGLFLTLDQWIKTDDDTKCAIEQVHSMPGQGVSSSFKFGKNFGIALGVVAALGIPLHRVTPQRWKGGMSLLKKDKDASRQLATEFWPNMSGEWKLKKDNGISDAALIAEWGRRTL